MREYRQYIGGEWIGSAELFDDLDPYRGTVMARIPAGTRADAARAVDAAAAAFPAWAELPPAEKQTLFLRAADIVERRRGDIVGLLAAETGCAAGFAGFQVLTATRLLRQAANWGYLPVGEVIRSDVPERSRWRCAGRSGWWPGSRPGTAPTCWPGGRWSTRSPSATRWC